MRLIALHCNNQSWFLFTLFVIRSDEQIVSVLRDEAVIKRSLWGLLRIVHRKKYEIWCNMPEATSYYFLYQLPSPQFLRCTATFTISYYLFHYQACWLAMSLYLEIAHFLRYRIQLLFSGESEYVRLLGMLSRLNKINDQHETAYTLSE